MFKSYYLILLLGHILGDYYFQREKLSKAKNEKLSALFIHCGVYAILVFAVMRLAFFKGFLYAFIFIALSHLIIDLLKFLFINNVSYYESFKRNIYIADQLLHLICIGIGAYMLMNRVVVSYSITQIFNTINVDCYMLIKIIILFLLMHKPANITIKKLIEWYKPFESNIEETRKSTGAFIGTIERYIILILLFLNQYSAIGLVLTAKSIARYHELENKEFAEYYLIGTLLSTFIVIVGYLLIG